MPFQILARAEKSRILLMPLKGKVPIFEGYLKLKDTPKGPRIYKFLVRKDGERYLPPDDVLKLLRRASVIYIARGEASQEKRFSELLEAYQLSVKKVVICPHCLAEHRVTAIDGNACTYRGDRICERCAVEELRREADFRGMGRSAKLHLVRLLRRNGNLDDVLSFLSSENLDPDLTRFDIIQAKPEEDPMELGSLDLPEALKGLLVQRLDKLLPVQSRSVRGGLLSGKNQLVVSATATGKSLIGEMAGIKNLLDGRGKLLFLVPLVALANQKFDQLSAYKELGLSASIKVGVSRIRLGKMAKMPQDLNADIIVGTYEGIDQALRTNKSLGSIGTVVIDEVHMLEDAERGHRLAGLIARLRFVAPQAQFIYLSATVGNPATLAKGLGSDLIEYEVRPVPIERHLIFTNGNEKRELIRKLVRSASSKRSSTGYRGQTIVFTNSRRNCFNIAKSIPGAAAYHAGLQYHERKKIEDLFGQSKLDAVITTSALAAGVDFPASQVIFESLAMGIEWLSVHEFNQMLGRAGRPGYHDRGVVYLLTEPGRKYQGGRGDSEDEVAVKLLSGQMEDVVPEYGEEEQQEEVLANTIIAGSRKNLETLHSLTFGMDGLDKNLSALARHGLVKGIEPTKLGRAAAAHFLSPEQLRLIKKGISAKKSAMEVAVSLEHFEDLYLKAADRISISLGMRISQRALHGSVLEIMNGEDLHKLDRNIQEMCMNFSRDFLQCRCEDAPYCGCAERNVSVRILDLRREGKSPNDIIQEFSESYGIYAYTGDLINYLDQTVRYLEAIEAVARIKGRSETAKEAQSLRKKLENG
jgi:helicase